MQWAIAMTVPDPAQLPHLLALLDDESRLVRDPVLRKLAEFGPALEDELRRLADPPAEPQLEQLRAWLDQYLARVQGLSQEDAVGAVIGSALFRPGDLVRHRRYGYRGLVVEHDLRCKASQAWYRDNRTQPDRDQPWYHVLVDDSDAVTYAAQTSLLPDESDQEIRHVLVSHFFERGERGGYLRNAKQWPQER